MLQRDEQSSWHRVVVSHDLGKTWRDSSEGLSPSLAYFIDNEDETVFWGLSGYPENGDTFRAPAKVAALNAATAQVDAQLAAYRDDPRARIVTLDNEHPYRRTVDLAKLYRFPGPGKYRVQPSKTLCPFYKGDASFAGQVIDVTTTP